jgi:hypothetical protein
MPKAETGSTTSYDYAEFANIVHAQFGDERSLYEHMATYADSLRGDITDDELFVDDSDDMDEFEREFEPKNDQPRKKVEKGLAKTALPSLSDFKSKVQTAYFGTMATAVAKFPGTKSKEELLELDQAQKEKFASSDSDGFFARRIKAIRRNKYQLYSWAPVAIMGATALEMYAMRTVGYFSYINPVEQIPFDTLPSSVSLHTPNGAPVANLPDANIPAPVPHPTHNHAPHSAFTPAPAPVPGPDQNTTSQPTFKHKWPVHNQGPSWHSSPHQGSGGSGYEGNGDIAITVPGASDPTGAMVTDQYTHDGMIKPGTKVLVDDYSASMIPGIVGTEMTDVSVAGGVQHALDLVHQHPGAHVTLYGFSEGTMVTNTTKAILEKQGIHVNVVNSGDPGAPSGLENNPLAGMFAPIVRGMMHIHFTPPLPGTEERVDGMDAWGASAGDGIGEIIPKGLGIPQFHRIPGADEVPVMSYDLNGVHVKVFSTPVRLPEGAVLTSGTPLPGISPMPGFGGPGLGGTGDHFPGTPDPEVAPPQPGPDQGPLPPPSPDPNAPPTSDPAPAPPPPPPPLLGGMFGPQPAPEPDPNLPPPPPAP